MVENGCGCEGDCDHGILTSYVAGMEAEYIIAFHAADVPVYTARKGETGNVVVSFFEDPSRGKSSSIQAIYGAEFDCIVFMYFLSSLCLQTQYILLNIYGPVADLKPDRPYSCLVRSRRSRQDFGGKNSISQLFHQTSSTFP
jgi:hypothetical protein